MAVLRVAYLAFLFVAFLSSCKSTHYELELRPDGESLHRKVSMWVQDSEDGETILLEFPVEELQHVADVYGAKLPSQLAEKHEFEGPFTGELPDDLGGHGWFLHSGTSMGSQSAYFERFGNDQIAIDLRARETAINRLVDVFIAWLESEYGADPELPEFRQFIDEVVRNDLWNLVLYSWGYDLFGYAVEQRPAMRDEERIIQDMGIRVVAYLAEHDYFDPLQIPQFVAASAESDNGNDGPLLTMTARSLARKTGVPADAPLPAPLAALVDDWEQVLDSLDTFSSESDAVHKMVAEWNSSGENPVELAESGDSVLEQLLSQSFLPDFELFGQTGSRLRASLHIPDEPIATNGQWNAAGTVEWLQVIHGRADVGENLPDMLYANWSEPAVPFQLEHFGRLVMQGEELAEHVFWIMGLTPSQVSEWDEFLASLEPGPELIKSLLQFCLSGDEAQCAKYPGNDESYYDSVDDIVWLLNFAQEQQQRKSAGQMFR